MPLLETDCLFVIVVNGTLTAAQILKISRDLNAALVHNDGPILAPGEVAESGLVAGVVLSVLVLAVGVIAGYVWWRCKPRPLRIFLSYRVFSDADLARTLFERLTDEGIDVWWDKECLPKGKSWEEGFADGLFGSALFVPILSKAALAPFAGLDAQAGCDNVFLEHRLALEMLARGRIKRIFPIFVGERREDSSQQPSFGDANPGKILPSCKDVLVPAVERKVTEHLRRKRYRRQRLVEEQGAHATTVGAVVRALTQNQGELLSGTQEAAIERLVASVQRMVAEETALQRGDPDERNSRPADSPHRPSHSLTQKLRRFLVRRLLPARRSLPDEVTQLELTDRSSPSSRGSVALHGCGERGQLSGFFSSIVHEGGDKILNPLLVHKAKETREAERRKPSQLPGSKYATGGLARLDTTPRPVQSDEQQLDQYLRRHEKVATSGQHSAAEKDRLQAALEMRRASENLARSDGKRRQSQVSRARYGTTLAEEPSSSGAALELDAARSAKV